MMPTIGAHLRDLTRERPEWHPWLSLVGEALQEASTGRWQSGVPAPPRPGPHVPLLAQTSIVLEAATLRSWIKRLLRAAAAGGTGPMASLDRLSTTLSEASALFRLALCQDARGLETLAVQHAADPGAFRSVAELIPLPFLQACKRAWASPVAPAWLDGYCPLCGAWPALAEVRGIDRAHYLRCARCGQDWQSPLLRCPFCDNDAHDQLTSLVPQNDDGGRAVDACMRCRGYVKSFTRLQGAQPLEVLIDDLASVDLDIAAVEQGYRRPPAPGYALNLAVSESAASRQGFFSWIR